MRRRLRAARPATRKRTPKNPMAPRRRLKSQICVVNPMTTPMTATPRRSAIQRRQGQPSAAATSFSCSINGMVRRRDPPLRGRIPRMTAIPAQPQPTMTATPATRITGSGRPTPMITATAPRRYEDTGGCAAPGVQGCRSGQFPEPTLRSLPDGKPTYGFHHVLPRRRQ
jgi:hypothetical protein